MVNSPGSAAVNRPLCNPWFCIISSWKYYFNACVITIKGDAFYLFLAYFNELIKQNNGWHKCLFTAADLGELTFSLLVKMLVIQ